MRLLIIGGGRFLGRSFAEEAIAAGHEVTLFNRGQTSVVTPGATVVHGDRADSKAFAELARQGSWDAVVDTCDASPLVVGQNARALVGRAGAYLFVSSVSAFSSWLGQPLDQHASLYDGAPDAADGDYGAMKSGAERAVREAFGDRALILYPGLIIGPYEDQGRQTWWLSRMARGGEVLAPGDPDRQIRLIDARDIAQFGLSCLAAGRYGGFIVTCPAGHVTFGEWLRACADRTGSGATLTWAPDAVLREAGVGEFVGLPLWAAADGEVRSVWEIDVTPAVAAGLRCRPIEQTVADTWQWLKNGPASARSDEDGQINGNGLSPADEQRILTALPRPPDQYQGLRQDRAAASSPLSDRLPGTPYRGSDVIRVEWNLEILLGGKYFAAKSLLSREYGSLSVVSGPEVRQQETRRPCPCGPPSGFLGAEQIADGLV